MDQLNAMRAFIRVAETGSFSAAARSSATTQATISKRVAALEEILGVKLLIRSSREQSLTEAGQRYFEQCKPILEAIDEAENTARCQSQTPRGLLRITASVDFGRQILSPLLQDFMTEYPDIQIDLVLSNYYLDLIAGGIDVAIRAGQFTDSSLVAKRLGDLSLHMVASPEYLAMHGQPTHPKALENHDCLLYSPANNPRRWQFCEAGKTFGVFVNGKFQCDDGELILDMVLGGFGISLLPYWVIHKKLKGGELKLVLEDFILPPADIKMVYPDRKHLPLKTRCFLDFMADKIAHHPSLTK